MSGEALYRMCALCEHFVEENDGAGRDMAQWVHLDDGEKEHDHDAQPSDPKATLAAWQRMRPWLFETDPATGKVGPNRVVST